MDNPEYEAFNREVAALRLRVETIMGDAMEYATLQGDWYVIVLNRGCAATFEQLQQLSAEFRTTKINFGQDDGGFAGSPTTPVGRPEVCISIARVSGA